MLAGLFVFLAGAVPLGLWAAGEVAGIEWRPIVPTAWLLRSAASGSGDEARFELERRRAAGRLSPEQIKRLFRQELATVRLEAPRQVKAGEPISWRIAGSARGTPLYCAQFVQVKLSVDGAVVLWREDGVGGFSLPPAAAIGSEVHIAEVGHHKLECTGQVQISAGLSPGGVVIWSGPFDFVAACEVLP
ncbi:MAG: hypothetical protein AB1716_07370 [Planctomycetota bacterium]